MKNRYLTLGAAFSVALLLTAKAQVTIGYNFASGTHAPSGGTPVNFSVSPLTIGNINGTIGTTHPDSTATVTVSSNNGGPSVARAHGDAAISGGLAIGSSSYHAATVNPSTGLGIRFTDFDIGVDRPSASTNPTSYAIRWWIDSHASTFARTTTGTIGASWALEFGRTAAGTSTAADGAVTFRLYPLGRPGADASSSIVPPGDISPSLQAVPKAGDIPDSNPPVTDFHR